MSDFQKTRWSLVRQAGATSRPDAARAALSDLCAAYYEPIVRFLRAEGRREDEARELAHEFFSRLLATGRIGSPDEERGRFRSFLLGALKHFLADRRKAAMRLKRGAGIRDEPLPSHGDVPEPETKRSELEFDRQWALTVLARAVKALELDMDRRGKRDEFDVLKPWLTSNAPAGQSETGRTEAAAALGVSENAFNVALHRFRGRFRDLVRGEIAQTVDSESDLQDELRYLVEVIGAAT